MLSSDGMLRDNYLNLIVHDIVYIVYMYGTDQKVHVWLERACQNFFFDYNTTITLYIISLFRQIIRLP